MSWQTNNKNFNLKVYSWIENSKLWLHLLGPCEHEESLELALNEVVNIGLANS